MTCRYFERDDGHDVDEGNCKRMPPTACFDADDDCCVTAWPLVVWTDWCGEYAARDDSTQRG